MEQPLKILFADDSQETLDLLKWHSEDEGWEGHYAMTARGIIDAVNEHCEEGKRCFDAIVADVNYFDDSQNQPRLTGITAAREVRKKHPNIPIIFISGWISILVREEARKLDGYIMAKPIDWNELCNRIKYLVQWSRIVAGHKYDGDERRVNSLNRTANTRRSTDMKPVAVPLVLENAMKEVRLTMEATKSDADETA